MRHLVEEFLAKAKEADEQASRCRDHKAKQTWKEIADGYRVLARRNGHSGNESAAPDT